eukprot:CAMPEP_0183332980 /NCGR_PEP_ID=MMETSP0164_2-20130417/2011_1 /TAXON_ID=221442 /ORGANISM="Coccolithus pelagicus ssp braarudi, Strain PLY182g" /LENGTH=98 /DNA_ID=CAMNT_0025501801 /DNA_START=529 /DNA_END=825 /DNA_ORIENTATION=+
MDASRVAQLQGDIAASVDSTIVPAVIWAVHTIREGIYRPFEHYAMTWLNDTDAMLWLTCSMMPVILGLILLCVPADFDHTEETQGMAAQAKHARVKTH